jgi:NADH dehydrogenase FAD-containing subunit
LNFVRIKVIEASSKVLAPFDKSLQEEAINVFLRKVRLLVKFGKRLFAARGLQVDGTAAG